MNKRVTPHDGGCWFCYTKTNDMVFDTAFDTFVHRDCLVGALIHAENPEAVIIAEETFCDDAEISELANEARKIIDAKGLLYTTDRNLQEDLETCYAATEGPWGASHDEWPGNANLRHWVSTHHDGLACAVSYEDARFIAEARDGWPHAIERALDAEMKVAQMERRLRAVESTVGRMLDPYGCQDFWAFVMEYESEEVSLDDKV